MLGLAYVASWRKYDFGGICSVMSSSRKEAGNIGITSKLNQRGNPVLSLQSVLTTAHEIGHNFGSFHDDPNSEECAPPSSKGGHYIMYPTSEEGYYSNNALFSPCSRKEVYKVLESKASNCLTTPSPYLAFCGNGRKEGGEECDPGNRLDPCCTDMCRLAPGADCR